MFIAPLNDSVSMLSKHPDHLETTPNQTTNQSTSTDTPEYTHRSSTPTTIQSPPTKHRVITNFTRPTTSPNRPPRHARTPRIQSHTSPPTINSTSTNQLNLHTVIPAHMRASISFTSNKQTTSLTHFYYLWFPHLQSLYPLFQTFTPFSRDTNHLHSHQLPFHSILYSITIPIDCFFNTPFHQSTQTHTLQPPQHHIHIHHHSIQTFIYSHSIHFTFLLP